MKRNSPMRLGFRPLPALVAFAVLSVPPWLTSSAWAAPPVDYLKDVKPLLAKNCFQCHGAKAHKGGLRVDTLQALLAGGDTGPAIVPGKSGESLLIAAVSGAEGMSRMAPKKTPLSDAPLGTQKGLIHAG